MTGRSFRFDKFLLFIFHQEKEKEKKDTSCVNEHNKSHSYILQSSYKWSRISHRKENLDTFSQTKKIKKDIIKNILIEIHDINLEIDKE